MTNFRIIIRVMLLGLLQEATRIKTGANEATLPHSKRSMDNIMPEDILLDNIQDDKERLRMETQLNELRKARQMKNIVKKQKN